MPLTPRFIGALAYATLKHETQVRKGSDVPYLSHLLGVCGIALDHGANEDEAIAALLHDAVEDQGGRPTSEEIGRLFGAEVRRIVEGCTDADVKPKPPWRARKEKYIAHVRHADKSVRLVSSSDKLHNARSLLQDFRQIGDALWPRFTGGKDGTLWYYRSLVTAFREAGSTPLIEELDIVVTELERLARA